VFERFRQADSSSTRMHGGLGLGLALVKHLVELHGGHVMAHSDGIGRGAAFTVSLPMASADAIRDWKPRATSSGGALPAPSRVARLDGLRILVADNDGEALTLVETILKEAGAEVRTCLSAAEAFEQLRVWHPDVLVSDIEMPGEDGYSLIRRIRGLPATAGGATPAIALTAYGRPQDRMRSLAGGFNMHVPKPVDPGELTAIIADVAGQPLPGRT
jgi:CheY-like chemotaxis protein